MRTYGSIGPYIIMLSVLTANSQTAKENKIFVFVYLKYMCNSAVLCVTAYECVDRDRARLYGVCLCDKNIQENSIRKWEREQKRRKNGKFIEQMWLYYCKTEYKHRHTIG